MMRLPVAIGIDPNPSLGLHRGWTKEHAAYNAYIEERLDKLANKASNENWNYRKIQQEITQLQREIRRGFQTGKFSCAK